MIEMAARACLICTSCYGFCSVCHAGCHADGHVSSHSITHPAAQGQQNNHEGQEQMTHDVLTASLQKSSPSMVMKEI